MAITSSITANGISVFVTGPSVLYSVTIELCRSFTKRPHQQEFWDMVKSFTVFSGSQYDPLLHRIAASVRADSLKTLAINLGCTAFAGRADCIRRNHANGMNHCWVQRFRFSSLDEKEIAIWNEKAYMSF